MNYYQARKKKDEDIWHWTVMNDGRVALAGACRDENGACVHKTAREAELHEAERKRKKFLEADIVEVDTKYGHSCFVDNCEQKAFFRRQVPGLISANYTACEQHLDDPPLEAFHSSEVISSN